MVDQEIKKDFKLEELIDGITNKTSQTITKFVSSKCEELTKFIKEYETSYVLNVRGELMEAIRKHLFDDYKVKRISTINTNLAAKESLIPVDNKETKVDPKSFCEYLISNGLYAMINYSRYGTDYIYMVCENGYVCNIKYGLPTKFESYSYFPNISLPYCVKTLIQTLSFSYEDVIKTHQLFKNNPELYNLNCEYYFELIGIDKKLKAENDRIKAETDQIILEKAKIEELRENFVMAEKRKAFTKELDEFRKAKEDLTREKQLIAIEKNTQKMQKQELEKEKKDIEKDKKEIEDKNKKLVQRESELDIERDSVILLKDKYTQKLKDIQKFEAKDEIDLHDDE
jgi:phage-related minor tail protein